MEGKAVLFKEVRRRGRLRHRVDSHDPVVVIQTVKAIAPTFGGINLEDIKAPECFAIEETLRRSRTSRCSTTTSTARRSSRAWRCSTCCGTRWASAWTKCGSASRGGAAAISCAELMVRLGVRRERILLVDSRGVIYRGRTESMNKYKERFAVETSARTLADAVAGADVFYGPRRGRAETRDAGDDGRTAAGLRHGEPRPGDQVRAGVRNAARRHHRHRPVGLPQPDQQRAGLPVHLPRRVDVRARSTRR